MMLDRNKKPRFFQNELLVNKIRRHVNDDNPRTIFTTPPVSVVAKIIRTTRIEILVIEVSWYLKTAGTSVKKDSKFKRLKYT